MLATSIRGFPVMGSAPKAPKSFWAPWHANIAPATKRRRSYTGPLNLPRIGFIVPPIGSPRREPRAESSCRPANGVPVPTGVLLGETAYGPLGRQRRRGRAAVPPGRVRRQVDRARDAGALGVPEPRRGAAPSRCHGPYALQQGDVLSAPLHSPPLRLRRQGGRQPLPARVRGPAPAPLPHRLRR